MEEQFSGTTKNGCVITGFSISDVKGKIEYCNHLPHLLSGQTAFHFTPYRFEEYDVHYDSGSRGDEIKYRDIKASKYLDEGFMIEKNKYDKLMEFDEGYYVCFFKKSNLSLVWDVRKIRPPKWEIMKCPENTQFGGYNKKVDKVVNKLSYDDAITILWKNRGLNNKEKARCKEWLKKGN